MKALSYLTIIKLKNRLLNLKRKPAMLILYILMIVIIVGSFAILAFAEKEGADYGKTDKRILYLIITGVGFMFLSIYMSSGLSTGSTLFSMSDVGLLFVAPISPKKILFYGLFNTLGKAMLASIFIIYQFSNLKLQFGYGLKEAMALYLIYTIFVLFGNLLSIGIYIFSNQNPRRKSIIRGILYSGMAILLLAVLFVQKQENLSIMEAIFRVVDSKWIGYVPYTGWALMFFKGVTSGVLFNMLIPLGCYIFFTILVIYLLTIGKADYYEDVLLSTEVTHQKLLDMKEGRQVRNTKKLKVKAEDYSIIKGSGAVALAHKHLLEMKRVSRFYYIDKLTIIFAIGIGIAGYNIKGPEASYTILGILIYLLYFLTAMGKLRTELMKHYIYLIPDTSMKKVFWASLTSIIKPCIDAVILFGIFGITGGADPLTCIFFALAYAASGTLFVGFTLLYQRVLGGQPGKTAQVLVGMGLLMIFLIPAITISSVTGYLLPEQLKFLTMLPYSICCILFFLLLLAFSRNMLDKMEYNN